MVIKRLIQGLKPSVLIVDDDVRFCRLVKSILEKEGYTTFCVQSGDEGIEAAETLKPDVILLDICMPVKNGIQVCGRLKEKDSIRDIPVIFVTVNTDDDLLKEAFSAGGQDYIRKPLNRTELLVRIESILLRSLHLRQAFEEEKMRGIMELAGAVCHELSQPMQVISGYSDLLLMEVREENPLYPMLAAIGEQIGRMKEITAKMMHITRYETIERAAGRRFIDLDKAADSMG